MVVGLCQFDVIWENKEANKKKIISLIEACKSIQKIDWIIFPEMTLTGFSMNNEKTALSDNDINFFKDISIRFSLFTTFGGVINDKNRLITIDKDGYIIVNYAKMHLIAHYCENESYMPGNKLCGFEVLGMRIVPSICYDLRFSYLFWEEALKTDIYVNIANWPKERDEHWTNLLKVRAIENQAYMIGVNRVGRDPKLIFSGNSVIIDPDGNVVLACNVEEGIFYLLIEKNIVKKVRNRFPVIRDRKQILEK